MRRDFTFFVFLLSFFLICCESGGSKKDGLFWSGRDSYGREVSLSREPQRIISLSPCVTEILFMLGSEGKLVGISDFCNYPAGTDTIPHVGGLLDINVEALCALQPDVLLVGSIVSPEVVEQFERVGVPVFIIKAESSIEDIYAAVGVVGDIVGRKDSAEALNVRLKREIEAVRASQQHADTAARPSVYYVVGFGEAGDFTAPANSHINEIISLAGGRNIGETLSTWSVSREFLFESDPDIIIVRKEDAEAFARTQPYTSLRAVRSGHIYPIESGWIDIVTPRNMNAVRFIAEKCAEVKGN